MLFQRSRIDGSYELTRAFLLLNLRLANISEARCTLIRLPILHLCNIQPLIHAVAGTELRKILDHAPSNTPVPLRDLRDLIGPHDSLHVTASVHSLCFRPAADRDRKSGDHRNKHSGAAYRKDCPHSSRPNEIFGEERRTNLNQQATPADSKVTERSRCVC